MAGPSFSNVRKLAAAKSHEYSLVSGFKRGYRNREDNTTLPPDVLIQGSQNVLTNTNQRSSMRKGYAVDGQEAPTYTYGAELVTNGSFTGNANGWGLTIAPWDSWTYSSNSINANTASLAQAYQLSISLTPDTNYQVEFDVTITSGLFGVSFIASDLSSWTSSISGPITTSGHYTFVSNYSGALSPTSASIMLETSNGICTVDNVSVKEATAVESAPIGGQNGAMGVFDWYTSGGGERNMRAGYLTTAGNDGKLQFRHVDALGNVTWLDLVTGLSSIDFNFITFWDADSLQTLMVAVNGTTTMYTWNGQSATVLSGANPSGIIEQLIQPGDDNQATVSGGVDYLVDDILTIAGGDSNATVKVLSITGGAIKTASVTAGGSGYVPGDIFDVTGAGTLTAVGVVDTVTGGGVVNTFHFTGRGTGYVAAAGVTTTALSGGGTGFTVHITAIGNAISDWEFQSDADHGTSYSGLTSYSTTGGAGTGALFRVQGTVSGTITKSGTQTWAETGFIFGTNAPQTVVIDGVVYTYQAAFFVGDTTTLYGVTPDPSGITPGSLIVQGVNTQTIGITNFLPNLISTLDGYVFVGSLTSSYIFMSTHLHLNTWDLTNTLVLPNPSKAMVPQEEAIYISSGRDQWYQIYFTLATDLTSRALVIKLLNTASQQATQSQAATGKIANSIAFLSFEPVIEALGRVPNILAENAPQMSDLSSPIVNDMNAYNLTNTAMAYHRKFFYVAVPHEGLVLVYNMTDPKNPYWEAPQILPISRFSIIDGELYGHSSQVSETYQLFTGTADRVTSTSQGAPIAAVWTFAYDNYGSRYSYKKATKLYVEGYINANTTLKAQLTYELDGCKTVKTFELDGSNSQFVCIGTDESSLGKVSLGKVKLGGDKADSLQDLPPKFRWFPTFSNTDFFESSVSLSVIGLNQQMELLAFGLAVSGSSEIPVQNYD